MVARGGVGADGQIEGLFGGGEEFGAELTLKSNG